jgi:hypothetical protein
MTAEQRDSYAVDKSAWGDGPWQSEPDRVDWIHAGLACFTRRHPRHGSWCAYVGVPREHPLYGKEYDEVDLDFHGGLSYSAPCDGADICHVPRPGMPDDVWWFGGDFAHFRDLTPGFASLEAGLNLPRVPAERLALREVYRELPYVRAEVNALAEQLAAFTPHPATTTIA